MGCEALEKAAGSCLGGGVGLGPVLVGHRLGGPAGMEGAQDVPEVQQGLSAGWWFVFKSDFDK